MNGGSQSAATLRFWLLAGLLMAAEFLVFTRIAAPQHAAVYPRWTDQIQYLTDAYTAHDYAKAHGLLPGMWFGVKQYTVQGALHSPAAVLAFWVAGDASRTAALSVNLVVFLLWQAALLFAVRRLTGSSGLAWMGFGLLLCVLSPWSVEAGSAADFRLDHAAMCLFGVTASVALLTDGFRASGWSLAFGVVTGLTLAERFLSGVYFAALFAATAAWILAGDQRWLRLRNLLLAGLVAAALALPVFWINRAGIYEYYWVGHVTGAESTARLRGFDLLHSAAFVADNLARLHLGAWFGWAVAGGTAALGALGLVFPQKPAEPAPRGWLWFGLTTLLLPAAILTVHRQKSEFVLGILVPGLLVLVLWLWHRLWQRIAWPAGPVWSRALPVLLASAFLLAGAAHFARRQLAPQHSPEFLAGNREILAVADYIFQTARGAQLANPDVGIDRVVDYLDGRILRVICYERHQVWVGFQLHLPDSILAAPDETVFFKLKSCDFMIVTEPGGTDFSNWPYEMQMRRLSPEVTAWCNEHLVLARTFSAFGRRMFLYQRPEIP